MELLAPDQSIVEDTKKFVKESASKGFRTLVVCEREISNELYASWQA
jgi:magnesium-transporting ATPase (P-type)